MLGYEGSSDSAVDNWRSLNLIVKAQSVIMLPER